MKTETHIIKAIRVRPDLAARNRANAKHGMADTPTFFAWGAMRRRCQRPAHPAFKDYGGRGITVCERWNDFANFLADMGEKPEGKSLDRIDNSQGYSPENCRWTDQTTQGRNRRSNRLITFNNETHCVAEWAEIKGIERKALQMRLKAWGVERALTEPYEPRAKAKKS